MVSTTLALRKAAARRGLWYPTAKREFIHENVTSSKRLALPYRHCLLVSVCCPVVGLKSGSAMLLSRKNS
ncbi:unnamed protein product [Urochloa humidicola]